MSYMSELHMEIIDMLEQGEHPVKISALMGVPVSAIYEILETQEIHEKYSPFETVNS